MRCFVEESLICIHKKLRSRAGFSSLVVEHLHHALCLCVGKLGPASEASGQALLLEVFGGTVANFGADKGHGQRMSKKENRGYYTPGPGETHAGKSQDYLEGT